MDALAVTVERYETGEEDLLYIVKAANEDAAIKINSSFEIDALETVEHLGDTTYVYVDLSNDRTVTLRDPLQLYHPMPSHINDEAIVGIQSFTICEPYLHKLSDSTGDFLLRRWTIGFVKQMCPTKKRYIWAAELTDDGDIGEWEILESSKTTSFPANLADFTQAKIVAAVMPKLMETLESFNSMETEPELTAELLWYAQNAMTTFPVWTPEGEEQQTSEEDKKLVCSMRSREEAARMYRATVCKCQESAWAYC